MGSCVEKVKGLSKTGKKNLSRDYSMVMTRGKGRRGGKRGKGGINGDGRRLDLG